MLSYSVFKGNTKMKEDEARLYNYCNFGSFFKTGNKKIIKISLIV